ncbi:MAG: hypothetical protein ACRD26_08365 [Vicinamibacterales bacterium]
MRIAAAIAVAALPVVVAAAADRRGKLQAPFLNAQRLLTTPKTSNSWD